MKVIEFLGTPRSGKTTQANFLKQLLEEQGKKVALLSDRERTAVTVSVTEPMPFLLTFFAQVIDFYFSNLGKVDYLLLDIGFVDSLIWADVRYRLGLICEVERDAFTTCFLGLRQRVDTCVYFFLPIDVVLERYGAMPKLESIDELAMNRKWLETIEASYQAHESTFPETLRVDGLVSSEKTISRILEHVA